jgi:Holliday junction DNA helicase RuvB
METTDKLDRAFRPQTLADCLGQNEIRQNLQVYVAAAKARNEPIEHLLFCGPAGLGKTTLAGALAADMGGQLITVNAASVKNKDELRIAILKCGRGDILFIDEIHALKRPMQEMLYTVMEDSRIEVGSDSIHLAAFTIIGATTHQGKLSKPMRERFGDICELRPYSLPELTSIVQRAAGKMSFELTPQGAMEIATRAQSTPRIALRITRRARDFALATKTLVATHEFVQQVCKKIGIDAAGLDPIARRVLRLLAEKGRATGLQAIAAQLGEALETIEDCVEPFLLAQGFIEREQAGRVVTTKGAAHLRTCGFVN